MRIVSLVPHATELLFALGLGDQVVGVTHECDYPPAALELPQDHARRAARRASAPPRSTPRCASAPRRARRSTSSTRTLLADLEPDLIVTQELCPVCAVSYDEVAGGRREARPAAREVIALDPKTFGETMGDIRTVAQATGAREAALDLVARQRARVDRVKIAVKGVDAPQRRRDRVVRPGLRRRPLDAAADRAGRRHRPARLRRRALRAAAVGGASRPPGPRSSLCMPCGYDGPRALAEAEQFTPTSLRAIGASGVDRARRLRLLLAPRPAPGRRPRDARPRAAPGPRPGGAGPRAPRHVVGARLATCSCAGRR